MESNPSKWEFEIILYVVCFKLRDGKVYDEKRVLELKNEIFSVYDRRVGDGASGVEAESLFCD